MSYYTQTQQHDSIEFKSLTKRVSKLDSKLDSSLISLVITWLITCSFRGHIIRGT